MEHAIAIQVFGALAQDTRLAVFRLLVKAGPKGLAALEISRNLGIVPSTLSGHLAILRRSGLLKSTRHQREIHYAVDMSVMAELLQFLVSDCCNGKFEDCTDILSVVPAGLTAKG